MEFFEVVNTRRSVRKYTSTSVPAEVMEKAIQAALVAPNSSNLQTWQFYWVHTASEKEKLAKICLSQGAARTAQEMLVVVAAPYLWKKNCAEILKFTRENRGHAAMFPYYEKVIPFLYGSPWLSPLKWILGNAVGLFRPMSRGPAFPRDIQEVSVKSAALASENFMLAIRAQGFDTCPMEGFDEARLKKFLKLKRKTKVVMVISVGERDPKGIWGPQVRMPPEWFVKKI